MVTIKGYTAGNNPYKRIYINMISKSIRNRAKKVGLAPGSLVNGNGGLPSQVQISIIDYDAKQCVEKIGADVKQCLACLKSPTITWIHICGIHDKATIETLGQQFGLHPLLLEDIMTIGQRSKLDNYKDTIFIVTQMLMYNEETQQAEDEQVSIVLGPNYLISFVESNKNLFAPVRERLRNPQSRIRQRGADYLCYSLLDCIVDNYFLILEKIDIKVEYLEQEVTETPDSRTLQKIQQSKREVTLLRRAVWPMREVISNLRRIDSPLVLDATKLYLHDVYDHTIQAIDTIESFRDITSGMLDIYLSNISQRMNEIMKVLTIVSTIFVPLTFIASIYGMNFDHIPELHLTWGYYGVLAIMACIAMGMIFFFRRKEWI